MKKYCNLFNEYAQATPEGEAAYKYVDKCARSLLIEVDNRNWDPRQMMVICMDSFTTALRMKILRDSCTIAE